MNTGASLTSGQIINSSFVEIGISLGNLGNPYAVYVSGCIIDETPFAERAFASFPLSFSGSIYYPTIVWNTYYGLHKSTVYILISQISSLCKSNQPNTC